MALISGKHWICGLGLVGFGFGWVWVWVCSFGSGFDSALS